MALTFTRRVGESFTLTWPTGEQYTLTLTDIGSRSAFLMHGLHDRHVVEIGAPIVLGVRSDKSLAEIGISSIGSGQVKLYVDAPLTVKVLRDNAKCREAKQ